MDNLVDLFGDESMVFVGLMIPFLGLLFPALVLLVIGLSHRISPHPAPALQPTPLDDLLPSRTAAEPAALRPAAGQTWELPWQIECLRDSDIFEGLTDDELRMVARIAEYRKVPKRARLVHAGDRGHHLFVVVSGQINLLSHPPAEDVVRVARSGQTIPLATIIDPPVVVTTVEAATDCEVLMIPRQPLIDLMEANPWMGFQVYRAAARAFEHRYRQTLDHPLHPDRPPAREIVEHDEGDEVNS